MTKCVETDFVLAETGHQLLELDLRLPASASAQTQQMPGHWQSALLKHAKITISGETVVTELTGELVKGDTNLRKPSSSNVCVYCQAIPRYSV